MTRPVACSLADLTSDTWHHVATQVTRGGYLVWDWSFSPEDRRTLDGMRYPDYGAQPTATTVIERREDGAVWLLAALMPVKAVAGIARKLTQERALGGLGAGRVTPADETHRPFSERPSAAERRVNEDWMTRALARANAGRGWGMSAAMQTNDAVLYLRVAPILKRSLQRVARIRGISLNMLVRQEIEKALAEQPKTEAVAVGDAS